MYGKEWRAIHSQANCRCQANYSWPGPSPVGLGPQLAPNTTAKDKQMLKSALKQQRELRLAITIDVSTSIPLLIHIYFLISHLVHEEFGPSFAWMGNLAALKAKLREMVMMGMEIWLSEL